MNKPIISPTSSDGRPVTNFKSVRVNSIGVSNGSELQFEGSMGKFASSTLSPTSMTTAGSKTLGLKPAGHHAFKKDPVQPQLRIVTDPHEMPTPSYVSTITPTRDLSQPPHKYPQHPSSSTRRVDSKFEAKPSPTDAPMAYVGTSYANVPNAHRVNFQPPPKMSTLPKPYSPLNPTDFLSSNMLNNRTASGRILGAAAQRFISESHIPVLPVYVDEPVGPDNLYVQMSETWTKCWDNEAGAVYYYNNITGEATWIQPQF
ncbi:hypothetical protein EON63_00155 [archaeon]|nr:MAG: hypothetical protein EON63_00155 [archaeon]